MIRPDLLSAIWRQNRILPLLLGGLLLLNLTALLLLTVVLLPQNVSRQQELVELQGRLRHGRLGDDDPETRFRQARADLERFRDAIPSRQEFSELLSDLSVLAGRAGLSVDQVKYSPKEIPAERLLAYSLAFNVTGRYDEIKRFIHGLEQSPRLIVIDSIALSAASRPDRPRQVGLQLALTTYFRSEGQQ